MSAEPEPRTGGFLSINDDDWPASLARLPDPAGFDYSAAKATSPGSPRRCPRRLDRTGSGSTRSEAAMENSRADFAGADQG